MIRNAKGLVVFACLAQSDRIGATDEIPILKGAWMVLPPANLTILVGPRRLLA